MVIITHTRGISLLEGIYRWNCLGMSPLLTNRICLGKITPIGISHVTVHGTLASHAKRIGTIWEKGRVVKYLGDCNWIRISRTFTKRATPISWSEEVVQLHLPRCLQIIGSWNPLSAKRHHNTFLSSTLWSPGILPRESRNSTLDLSALPASITEVNTRSENTNFYENISKHDGKDINFFSVHYLKA